MRYGVVYPDHIEWFPTFDEAWNSSRGRMDSEKIIYDSGHDNNACMDQIDPIEVLVYL